MQPLRVACALIGCFLIAERLLRQGKDAASLEEGPADGGTTHAIGRAFGLSMLALCASPLLQRRRIGRAGNRRLGWAGIAAMVAGLALRVWAARVLGAFYTRTLRISGEQHIVEAGPYRWVRHPGYLGNLLLWLGAGLATENWLVAAGIMVAMGRAYRGRIVAEETMLAEAFAESYGEYTHRSWRLIPLVY